MSHYVRHTLTLLNDVEALEGKTIAIPSPNVLALKLSVLLAGAKQDLAYLISLCQSSDLHRVQIEVDAIIHRMDMSYVFGIISKLEKCGHPGFQNGRNVDVIFEPTPALALDWFLPVCWDLSSVLNWMDGSVEPIYAVLVSRLEKVNRQAFFAAFNTETLVRPGNVVFQPFHYECNVLTFSTKYTHIDPLAMRMFVNHLLTLLPSETVNHVFHNDMQGVYGETSFEIGVGGTHYVLSLEQTLDERETTEELCA